MAQDWTTQYADKLMPARAAVRKIRRGDRVFVGSACGEPRELVRAMVTIGGQLADTEVVQVLPLADSPYVDPRYAGNFRANALFVGDSVREAVNTARADYTPVFLSQVPALFRSQRIPIDVALICVSPPDAHGHCSLGVSVDVTKAAAESAGLVIAMVNQHMPRTHGDCFIHVDRIHALVQHDEPLVSWPASDPGNTLDPITQQIANHVARLIPDGATLQLGIGRIPDLILATLTTKNDLGIHTEMLSDGAMAMVRKGVVTGSQKTLNKGKIVASFAAGTQELFEFLDANPMVEMHPSEYTNDPFVISSHDHMIAINAAVRVDLTGQVSAGSVGARFSSGFGGHADFIRGAALSRGGKPIIVMPSSEQTPDGLRSRIVASLPEGAGIATTRGDAHYIVTEYGVAYLHGKNIRDRAMSLIGIAHPDFRDQLLEDAKKRQLVYANQILEPASKRYPAQLEEQVTLRDGTPAVLRPIRPEDESMMKDMFYSFSEQTVYLRYHHVVRSMPHEQLQVFCNVDYEMEMTLIAVVGPPSAQEVVGVALYNRDPAGQAAELAFAVSDAWQRKGLGTILFEKIIAIARAKGISQFTADVLVENSGMLKIFHRAGMQIQTSMDSGVVHVEMQAKS